MAASNSVTLPPPDKRDATPVAECAAFDRLEQEFDSTTTRTTKASAQIVVIARYTTRLRRWTSFTMKNEVVAMLCQYRALTLVGTVARVRTLLHLSPEVFKPPDTDCWDVRMVGALLRDLRTLLKVDDA